MIVLGIETSCDETGVALYDSNQGILNDVLYSQIEMHNEYGGVVPELASRDHIKRLLPLINQLLQEAKLTKQSINAIAFTNGPGLIGALMVGACIGRSLAWALNIPAIAVHHMEGHLLAPLLERNPPSFPFIALLVSGGHTQLIEVNDFNDYTLLGQSLDDAAGEAFDKTAVMLGLGYPGGPKIAALAEKGVADRFKFPRPMTDRPGLDFSFSGLKTATYTMIEKVRQVSGLTLQDKADIALAFETAVVGTLTIKCRRALQATGLTRLVIGGGVSANLQLRESLQAMTHATGAKLYCARQALCTDNGAMIAYAGYQRLKQGETTNLSIQPQPRWSLDALMKGT